MLSQGFHYNRIWQVHAQHNKSQSELNINIQNFGETYGAYQPLRGAFKENTTSILCAHFHPLWI